MKKEDTKFVFRGAPLFSLVAIIYALLFVMNRPEVGLALQKSAMILGRIIPIFLLVILFTALINFLIPPKQLARHLGRESGTKGWLWALLAGIISHGPMYAWYPLLAELRSHGMRDGLLITFFAARVIKIPLLPLMIDYFGLPFTIILSFYIIIGALGQGLIFEILPPESYKDPPNQ